jgi:hypothetical protein
MMIVYPETAFEEVIEANRRRTWKINVEVLGLDLSGNATNQELTRNSAMIL